MSNNTFISEKQKRGMSTLGKHLVVTRIGFPHDGFYIVKAIANNPLRVHVHTTMHLNWNRHIFRISWQETLWYQQDAKDFLKKTQNSAHILTGLRELGVNDIGFRDLALFFPCWL